MFYSVFYGFWKNILLGQTHHKQAEKTVYGQTAHQKEKVLLHLLRRVKRTDFKA